MIFIKNFVDVERIQDLSFSNMADYTLKTLMLDQLEMLGKFAQILKNAELSSYIIKEKYPGARNNAATADWTGKEKVTLCLPQRGVVRSSCNPGLRFLRESKG